MGLEGGPPVASVGEREIDYAIAQFLMTSPQFSRWLVAQTVSEQEGEFAESIDVVTNTSYAGEGESDIEFGFLTQSGDRHVLLIENKIDATTQPNQLERYYNRGQIRVDRENWDAFTVCSLAPQSYLSPDDETAVDSIVQYEAVQSKLDDLSHDGTPFFQALFEAALTKSTTVDASPTIATIENRMHAQTGLPLRTAFAGKKRISFQSTHPQHPDAVWYDCFIGAVGDTGRTTVRLHIESIDGLTDDRRDSLETVISQHTEATSGTSTGRRISTSSEMSSARASRSVRSSSSGVTQIESTMPWTTRQPPASSRCFAVNRISRANALIASWHSMRPNFALLNPWYPKQATRSQSSTLDRPSNSTSRFSSDSRVFSQLMAALSGSKR